VPSPAPRLANRLTLSVDLHSMPPSGISTCSTRGPTGLAVSCLPRPGSPRRRERRPARAADHDPVGLGRGQQKLCGNRREEPVAAEDDWNGSVSTERRNHGGVEQPDGEARVIAYLRCSTDEQADSRAGLEAQRAAILAEAQRRGWDEANLLWIEDAGFSGKNLDRPGISAALDALGHHRANTLVVSKLDRLSRSMLDFAGLMDRANREHWALVALDLGVDTSTPSGEVMAGVLALFAQFERRLIGQRTRDALAQKRLAGVQLGRPTSIPASITNQIVGMRAAGLTLRGIVERLAFLGVPTVSGGRWQISTVQRVLARSAGLLEAAGG
jgi:DNA invertase Pin-like site-specific DNA recombinase